MNYEDRDTYGINATPAVDPERTWAKEIILTTEHRIRKIGCSSYGRF